MEKFDQIRMAGNLVEQLEILGFSANEIHSIAQYMMAHAQRLGKYRVAPRQSAQAPEAGMEGDDVGACALGTYKGIKIQPN